LTYTIRLHNSGAEAATADVTDPVPVELEYITDSATGGGAYDAGTHTLSWSAVNVPAGSSVSLEFAVKPSLTVTIPTVISNTATISATGESFDRTAWVTLIPESLPDDLTRPQVHSLTIGDQDVLTSPEVTLHISATDNVDVSWMYLREWQIVSTPWPHWEVVQSSGWVPFETDYAWTLGSANGVHYVGAWVADNDRNVSLLTREALDFASLVLAGNTVPQFGLVPYLVYYDAGVEVSAMMTPTQGDVNLYVWYPHNFLFPNQISAHPGLAEEEVHFTTPVDGVYIFIVHAPLESTYNLTITPGGGPSATTLLAQATNLSVTQPAPAALQSSTTDNAGEFLALPIFTDIGLDPLGTSVSEQPSGPFFFLFVPLVAH